MPPPQKIFEIFMQIKLTVCLSVFEWKLPIVLSFRAKFSPVLRCIRSIYRERPPLYPPLVTHERSGRVRSITQYRYNKTNT